MTTRSRAKAPTTSDPIEIAMAVEARDTSPESPARRLLLKQERLVDAQRRSENLGAGLKVLTGLAGLAAVAALAVMAWQASRADGLVIQPFSVPPALAERGVTGEALASQLMDRLSAMSRIARSDEAQRQLSGDLGQGVSLQIPETGVSLSQIDQWLREKLGDERRVTGELMEGEAGRLTLVARSGSDGLPPQTGRGAEVGDMLQRTAEALYAKEQPISHARYLARQARWADLIAHARALIATPSRRDRALGYSFLGEGLYRTEGRRAARAAYQTAVDIDDTANSAALWNLANAAGAQGEMSQSVRLLRRYLALLERKDAFVALSEAARRQRLLRGEALLAVRHGDYGQALANMIAFDQTEALGYGADSARQNIAENYAGLHDVVRARATLTAFERDYPAQARESFSKGTMLVAAEDWPGALANVEAAFVNSRAVVDKGEADYTMHSSYGLALGRVGRFEEAQAVLAATPLTCEQCVERRGQLADLMGDARLADHWFGQAAAMAPALPQTPFYWGKSLLRRGELKRAAEQFALARERGPRWADPLCYWGETLLRQGDPAGAIRKLKLAAKLAPAWSRTEIVWGEALMQQGKRAEALEHWGRAGTLFRTPTEQARLAADLKAAGA